MWTLEEACKWAAAYGYVVCSRGAMSAFAEAAHVAVTFDGFGGVSITKGRMQ